MNKYQEALDRIGRNYYLSEESGDFEHFENLYLENKKTLQELVDMREEVLKLCLIVIDSSWKSETYELPNGKWGDTGYSIDLAELIYKILNGSKE